MWLVSVLLDSGMQQGGSGAHAPLCVCVCARPGSPGAQCEGPCRAGDAPGALPSQGQGAALTRSASPPRPCGSCCRRTCLRTSSSPRGRSTACGSSWRSPFCTSGRPSCECTPQASARHGCPSVCLGSASPSALLEQEAGASSCWRSLSHAGHQPSSVFRSLSF